MRSGNVHIGRGVSRGQCCYQPGKNGQRRRIGENCVIGSGAVVTSDCEQVKPILVCLRGSFLMTIIIAEAGVNHNGDIDRAKKMIEVAAAGADYVKFQTFSAASPPKARRRSINEIIPVATKTN